MIKSHNLQAVLLKLNSLTTSERILWDQTPQKWNRFTTTEIF